MACIDHIRTALRDRRASPCPITGRKRFKLQLGPSAQRALIAGIRCERIEKGEEVPADPDARVPMIFEDMAVEKVETFPGWEIVELG